MKLYFSFGYVDEEGKSSRLFYMEQPLTTQALLSIVDSIRRLL